MISLSYGIIKVNAMKYYFFLYFTQLLKKLSEMLLKNINASSVLCYAADIKNRFYKRSYKL